jgi:glucose-1-phosphate adenylyltransferase
MSTWRCGRADSEGFVNPIIGGVGGVPSFAGTADAIYRNRREILDFCPDVVAIFSADHIYRMDVRQMVDFHLASGADVTVSALPVPLGEARSFGVLETDGDGRIRRFLEKPRNPLPMRGRPDRALASMGNYLFSPRVLLEALEATHAAGGTDFGGHLLPALVSSHRLMAYDFATNRIEGLPADCDPHYWRDVGTIDAYFAAHMDTMPATPGAVPRFDIAARSWPIRGAVSPFDPARREWSLGRYQCMAAIARTADVEQSILRQNAKVGERAQVAYCILGENVEVGEDCRLRNVIIEAGNKVPDGVEIGFDPAQDEWLPVSEGGIVVIPSGFFNNRIPAGRMNWDIHPLGRRQPGVTSGAVSTSDPGPVTGKAAATTEGGPTVSQIVPSLAAGAAQGPRRREVPTTKPRSAGARA